MKECWAKVKVVPTETNPCTVAKAIKQQLISVALENLQSISMELYFNVMHQWAYIMLLGHSQTPCKKIVGMRG